MLRSALEIRPDPLAHNQLLFALLSGGSFDPREVFEEHVRFAARYAEPLKPAQVEYQQSRHPGRRLRIGYVSPDLWGHPVAMLIGPVLAARDRSGSEIFLYSDTITHDAMTDILRRIADGWRDVRGLTDEQLCDVIRADRIDVWWIWRAIRRRTG